MASKIQNNTTLFQTQKLKKIKRFLQQENLDRLIVFILIFIVASAVGLSSLEPRLSFVDALWWSIVTLATVNI